LTIKSAIRSQSITIYDSEHRPSSNNKNLAILWRSYGDPSQPNTISIPRLVEEQADMLRSRYLSWVHDLGETLIDGKSLVEHLELRTRVSYWWMTPFVEKCNYSKSTWITDAIKLMAFEVWAMDKEIDRVRLISANSALAECLSAWSVRKAAEFNWQIEVDSSATSQGRRAYAAFPLRIRAILSLIHYVLKRWPLIGVGVAKWNKTRARTTFVSYMDNLEPAALASGRFSSRYWGNLPENLCDEGEETNWLHLFVTNTVLKNAHDAANALRSFNGSVAARGGQVHVALDSFLGPGVVFRALLDWWRISRKSSCLEKSVQDRNSGELAIWPLFRAEWTDSLAGTTALINLVFLHLLTVALGGLRERQTGVYLQENQGWEFGLLQAWKEQGHGPIAGSPHSTVRFWDLRYFFDPRSFDGTQGARLPRPDKVAINGPAAMQAYRHGNYPAEELVEVEALRYLHLMNCRDRAADPSPKRLRLLVLSDYSSHHTRVQMKLLEQALCQLPKDMSITLKPHPNYPVPLEEYPGLPLAVVMEPMEQLLENFDVVYTSSITSAAVDAYCAGITVISVLDATALNMSPLRGMEGVYFVSSPSDIKLVLNELIAFPCMRLLDRGMFTLDPELPRWKLVLQQFHAIEHRG
jgi:surface carbohydrate biosynthesis protein (TIGR04326 family)